MPQNGEKSKFIPPNFFDEEFDPTDKAHVPVVNPEDLIEEDIPSSGDEDQVPPKEEKK